MRLVAPVGPPSCKRRSGTGLSLSRHAKVGVVGCVECPEHRSASVQECAHKRERLLWHLLLWDMPTILENLEAPIRQVVGQFFSQRRRHHLVLSAPYHECWLLDRPIARNEPL